MKQKNSEDKNGFIALPPASAISKNEMETLHRGCEEWYDSALKPGGFNGGMLVAMKGNIIFEAYNGTGHLKGKDTINEQTPFHLASVSKTFTAMAVLKLRQEAKLNIDDDFAKYFPSFNYPGVTIRNLLSHRSGLPNYLYFMEKLGWDKKNFVTNIDVLNYLVTRKAELTNISLPNTHFEYCNTNYALLALLIEKITGEKYPVFIHQAFFTPLKMKNSFVFDTSMIDKVNPSYDWRGRVIPFGYLDAVYGDKNIYSTPRDMFIWDRAINSKKIFSDSTLKEAYKAYSNERPGIRNYGLGWRMNIYPTGKKLIYHNGWWHGNNAVFIRMIDEDATIILMGNKFNRNIYHAKDLAKLFDDYTAEGEEDFTDPNAPAETNPINSKRKK